MPLNLHSNKKCEASNVNNFKRCGLKILTSNVDVITTKMADVEQCKEEHSPDIMAFTEIKPKNYKVPLQEAELAIEGYHSPIHNLDNEGRGICIYVSTQFGVEVFKTSDDSLNCKESVWVKVKIDSKKTILLGCVYRSPSSDCDNNRRLESLLRHIADYNFHDLIIVGDFNYPNIDWENSVVTDNENSEGDQFLECLKDCFLIQHVDRPTRYRGDQKPSILDLVLTNEENVIKNMQYCAPLGNSDHCALVFEYKCIAESVSTKTKKYRYDKGNYDDMRANLADVDWTKTLDEKDTQKAWDHFSDILEDEMQRHIPTHTGDRKRKMKRQSYMDKQGMKLMKAKQRAWKHYTTTEDSYDYRKYCTARNKLRSYTRELRQNFEEALAREVKTNPKAFWRYTKTKLTVKSGVGDLKDDEGEVQAEDSAKADILNKFFCSVFTKENINNIPDLEDRSKGSELNDVQITEEIIAKHLQKLKISKSAGPDGFHPRVLKEVAPSITKPLEIIFRKSIESGQLPTQWKEAQVTPIFKKGDRSVPGNYRPVSLTSVICKVMESIIREALMGHMKSNELFCDEQHGFVPGRSCMTQLLVCLDEWTEALDKGDPLDTIYLDFRKAFDTVPHKRLSNKIKSYGIGGKISTWIADYLRGRTQRVSVNGSTSNWSDVTSGIPQGSVLGPILFVIFINDLPDAVDSVTRIFADDTKMYGRVVTEDDRECIQRDIERLSEWSEEWQLKFNTSKCSVMHLGQNNPKHTYTMKNNAGQDERLEVTDLEKDLGLHVDNKLTFHQHTSTTVGKANRILGIIKRTFTTRDNEVIKRLYTTMVRPILEYGNAPRIHQYAGDTDRMERVQRRATKLCTEVKDLTYEERLKRLRLPSLYYRRQRGDMIQVYKIVTGKVKLDQDKLLPPSNVGRTRGHNQKLMKRRSRLNLRKYSFGYRVVDDWNSLPDWVVGAVDLNDFKTKLDKCWHHRLYKIRPTHATVCSLRRLERELQA